MEESLAKNPKLELAQHLFVLKSADIQDKGVSQDELVKAIATDSGSCSPKWYSLHRYGSVL
jgi:hypothetical protein